MIHYKLPNCDVEVVIDRGLTAHMNGNELYPVSDCAKVSIVMKCAPWCWKLQGKLIPLEWNLIVADKATDLVTYDKAMNGDKEYLKALVSVLDRREVELRKEIAQLKNEKFELKPEVDLIWKDKINRDEEIAKLSVGTTTMPVFTCGTCGRQGPDLSEGKSTNQQCEDCFCKQSGLLEKEETWRDRPSML